MSARLMRFVVVALVVLGLTSLSWCQVGVTSLIAQVKQLKQQRRFVEAQRLLREGLAAAPDSAELHSALAWVLVAQGQKEEAVKHFGDAVRLAPGTPLAQEAVQALTRLGVTPPAQPPQPAAGDQPPPPDTAVPEKTRMIDDFEAADNAWVGLQRTAEAAGTGQAGGAWLDTAAVPTSMTHALHGSDWSEFTHLQMDVHSAVANNALITLAMKSDDPAVDGNDFYWMRLRINWVGWKVLRLPLSGFTASGKPLGFGNIQNIMMASNWGPCKPLPDTALYFDNIQLVKLATAKSLVLGNMDDDLDFWQGLVPEDRLVKEGAQAGRWEKLDEVPYLRYAGEPHDWRPFGALHMWVHSAVANGQELRVIAWSDSPDTKEMDAYRYDLKVDWQGWKELRLEDADFQTSYQPEGWGKISILDMVGAGYAGMAPPKSDTVLVFDDVRLEPLDPKADLVFMDFDTSRRTSFYERAQITDARAHGGAHSLMCQPDHGHSALAFANIPHDWSLFDALAFWVYTDEPNLSLWVTMYADKFGDQTPDGYRKIVPVPATGWSRVVIPIKTMEVQGHPLGLDHCQRLYIYPGDARTASVVAKTPIFVDDFALVRLQDL